MLSGTNHHEDGMENFFLSSFQVNGNAITESWSVFTKDTGGGREVGTSPAMPDGGHGGEILQILVVSGRTGKLVLTRIKTAKTSTHSWPVTIKRELFFGLNPPVAGQ